LHIKLNKFTFVHSFKLCNLNFYFVKNIYFFILVFSIFLSIESKAQEGMLSSLQGLDGESYGISAGIHTTIFDSNHADG